MGVGGTVSVLFLTHRNAHLGAVALPSGRSAACGLREGEEPSAFRRAESNAAQSPNGTEV